MAGIAELFDVRLARQYDGPNDPRFQIDTLQHVALTHKLGMSFELWDTSSLWQRFCDGLVLHKDTRPQDTAQRAEAVLRSQHPLAKELALIAELLGRAEPSRSSAAAAKTAVQEALEDEWRLLGKLKASGATDRRCGK